MAPTVTGSQSNMEQNLGEMFCWGRRTLQVVLSAFKLSSTCRLAIVLGCLHEGSEAVKLPELLCTLIVLMFQRALISGEAAAVGRKSPRFILCGCRAKRIVCFNAALSKFDSSGKLKKEKS